ncbi:MAG: 3-oxoacyl-[acyl-carrier-protein] synthase III C-terminal domain-containing protein [Bacteroidota bacterium]
MSTKIYSTITGTGRYLPQVEMDNKDFLEHSFYYQGAPVDRPTAEVIDHVETVTEIKSRRFIMPDLMTSDIAAYAGKAAIEDAQIDQEELDYIIVAHNFGDVAHGNRHSDMCPSLAARVKHKLGIKNPATVAYDLIFGCPGWIEGLIQANYFIRSGDVKKVLVIGAEALSRIADPNDKNCLLYSDGAGAVILEAKEGSTPTGIIGHRTRTDTFSKGEMLWMDTSYKSSVEENPTLYLKMKGKNVFRYAMTEIPRLIKELLVQKGVSASDIKKVIIHQANGKMVKSIVQRLLKQEGVQVNLDDILPMTVSWLGNNSVATVPILLDLIVKDEMEGHQIAPGDLVLFCSVGAGMNINAVLYRMPG